MNPLQPAGTKAHTISGSVAEIADSIRAFRDVGFTRLEIMLTPGTLEAFDALAPVAERVHVG